MINAVDEALGKLRQRLSQDDSLRGELEKLRQQNDQLRQRLEKLEGASSAGK